MKHNKKELDAMIEETARNIREEEIDASIINQSASRVWARVSQEAADNSSLATSKVEGINTMNPSNNSEQIRGCEDFQSLIPAYLQGDLSTARTLLLKDHANECIPCRKELNAQRAAKDGVYVPRQHIRRSTNRTVSTNTRRWRGASIARWSVAAAVLVCMGLAGLFVVERLDLSGRTLAATVQYANGPVYVVSDVVSRQLLPGDELQKGERVRTAKDSNAVLRLADGSTVEMRERSEFSVSENRRGVTLNLERGDVIIEAAEQHNGRLYVQTPDSLVSVKGTIFVVESGTKGSRVSVVEGEVAVNHSGKDETLLPGDQTATSPNLEKTSVKQTVAWSRNASRYVNLVTELTKLQRDVNQKVARPGVRHSSKFLSGLIG